VFLCFSRTDVFLWAKAEVAVKTRQVLHGVGFRYTGGLLRKRICAVKRNRRTKAVAEVIDSGYIPKRSNASTLTLRIPESVVGYPSVRFPYCLTSTSGLPTTGASKKGQSGLALLHLGGASLLAAAQMCFCPVKRKWRVKPAKFFVALAYASTNALRRPKFTHLKPRRDGTRGGEHQR
jgi:hypothetical protein